MNTIPALRKVIYVVKETPKRTRSEIDDATLAARIAVNPDTRATYGYI